MTLNAGQRHLLRLVEKDADADGWTPVSEIVWPLVHALPDDLVEKVKLGTGGKCRLRDQARAIIKYT